MGKKQSPAEILCKAEEKGAGEDTGIVTGEKDFQEESPC